MSPLPEGADFLSWRDKLCNCDFTFASQGAVRGNFLILHAGESSLFASVFEVRARLHDAARSSGRDRPHLRARRLSRLRRAGPGNTSTNAASSHYAVSRGHQLCASCELSLGCPPGPDRGDWSCEASEVMRRTG